ncbi:Hypp7105 [Branchiostoma lanceolatum]|uniref:Hypp7105 protein n=1 Tax=Branchiostoma lanceolatum TaxID=7740 RepID=A0A8J9YXC2_BRALA|nr:Hypp7105 [Branchiostoma lanceolatum]
MPFPVEKSCGTWKHDRHSDNYPQIMEKLGIPAEIVQKLEEATVSANYSLSGNKFTAKFEIMGKQHESTFTLGVEGEEHDPTVGRKRKITYTIEGDHLVSVYPDYNGSGTSLRLSRHFVDNDTIRSKPERPNKMPFPVEKSCGTWKHDRQSDNYPQIFEKLGIPAEMVQKLKGTTFSVNHSLSGDKFTSKFEFNGKPQESTFTLGVEGEEHDQTVGRKRKVTYTIEGDNLVSVFPDHDGKGTPMRVSRHFIDDDTIHIDVTVGGVEGWTTYKRC